MTRQLHRFSVAHVLGILLLGIAAVLVTGAAVTVAGAPGRATATGQLPGAGVPAAAAAPGAGAANAPVPPVPSVPSGPAGPSVRLARPLGWQAGRVPAPTRAGESAPSVRSPARRIGRAVPTRIRIPSIGVDRSRLVTLRTLDDGSLESPKRYGDIGWWKAGSVPGQEGAAIVVGHLDSPTGPAVFANLATLRPGNRISVARSDRVTVSFVVRSVELFPRSSFPGDRVYREGGPPGLVLITCGGQYDRAAGRYSSNVVVFTDLVPTKKTAASPGPAPRTTPRTALR